MTQPQTTRRAGRAYALQVLYALDEVHTSEGDDPRQVASDVISNEALLRYDTQFELTLSSPARSFGEELVQGAQANREALDDMITAASKNWRLERMSRVDRNVLRLAAYELMDCPDVPTNVVINEAVELSKNFGTKEAGAFVNGILDRIAKELRTAQSSSG